MGIIEAPILRFRVPEATANREASQKQKPSTPGRKFGRKSLLLT